MVRIISICSGKGGVGKTTVAANLAASLQKLGFKVAVIDLNLTTPHLGLQFGIYAPDYSINDFLRDEIRFSSAIYSHSSGLKIVPASLKLKDLINIDVENLKNEIKNNFYDFDYVILDSAPSLGREAMVSILASDEIIFVAEPFVPSLVDIIKSNQIINSLQNKPSVLGVVLNKVKGKKYEINEREVKEFTNIPIIESIPYDEKILVSFNKKVPIVFWNDRFKVSKKFLSMASKISGTKIVEDRKIIKMFYNFFQFFKNR